jgi:adenylate kinase family enzyme
VRKVNVLGSSGSGKTSFAAELAQRLGVPHFELDALHWGPNWAEPSPETFRATVQNVLESNPDGWVIDGSYEGKLGRMLVDAADTVVWLDLPVGVLMRRLWLRTLHRVRDRVELWNGNRENWVSAFWGRESLFVWTFRSYFRHRREWPDRFATHPRLVRQRTPREVRRRLDSVRPV